MDANTMEREMKEAIKKSGGLFYQYRLELSRKVQSENTQNEWQRKGF